MIIEDHCFEVKDKGKGLYAYVLVDGWYHIQVSPSQRKTLPPVYVQLSSYLITHLGINEAMSYLYTVSKLLGHKDIRMTQRYAHHCPESLRGGIEVLDTISTQLAQSEEMGITPIIVTS